jgi:hypothetical protein
MATLPPAFFPDQLAAHDPLSELRTRISPLPYQYGVEARAARKPLGEICAGTEGDGAPSWMRRIRAGTRTFGTPGFICLLREMTGSGMAENDAWLNVSDGGHIENIGMYELLRRKCKFIVCVDSKADPEFTFQGQLTLVRHAQIDLGIRIEPRLDEMRTDQKSRFSRTHAQLFRIIYPVTKDGRDPGIGLLLYLKLH